MPSRRLSPAARRFLAEEVHSVMHLELMLLLERDAGVTWTATGAAAELRAPEAWVAAQLADLTAAGVARAVPGAEGAYRFDPSSPRSALVREVAGHYPRRRTSLINLIFASSDVQSLSDAFRWREDDR